MKNWLNLNKVHVLAWFFLILYETVVVGLLLNMWANPINYFAHYAVTICLFYVNANVALKWALKNRAGRFWKIPLTFVSYMVVYIFLHYLVDLFLILINAVNRKFPYPLDMAFLLKNSYRGLYFLGFSTGYYFIRTYLTERRKTEALEKEQLNAIIREQKVQQELVVAQNAYLKAQINPHFLFNTLDFIYHHVNQQSPIAGEAVIRLAQMMRYAIATEQMDHLNNLEDEIEQVENLLYLNQVTKSNKINIEFRYHPLATTLHLIPLVLLTLVENIFKHGDLSNPEDVATIDVDIDGGMFHISTTNLSRKDGNKNGSHSGLHNIGERLLHAYAAQVQFTYGSNGQKHFKTDLKIPVSLLTAPALLDKSLVNSDR